MPLTAAAARSELANRTTNPTRKVQGGGQRVHVELVFDNVDYNPEDVFDALEAKYSSGGTLSTAQGSNKDITFTARARRAGVSSGNVRVRYVVAGLSTALSVAVSGNDITVNVATDGAGAATSTADQIIAAVNGDSAASALVFAARKATQNGTGVPAAMAYTALAVGTSKVTSDRDTQSGRVGGPLQFRISA